MFKGRSFASKLQRTFTRSEYDHVALLLKYSSGSIGLLEATGADGVSVVLWDDFLRFKWHKLYTKLVYRHLDFERTDDVISLLEGFIN